MFKHLPSDISIHALLAESDTPTLDLCVSEVLISIHALLAESDGRQRSTPAIHMRFLSTLSLRRATVPRVLFHTKFVFLSTLSLRRATFVKTMIASNGLFLSTLSLRRATLPVAALCQAISSFLSTLSLRRATGGRITLLTLIQISIHALLAESDSCTSIGRPKRLYFYPRSPCGERQLFRQNYECFKWIFLSTLSLRRATVEKVPADVYYQAFLSTLSLRRATAGLIFFLVDVSLFLSTLSLRRATTHNFPALHNILISIHALLAESDGWTLNINGPMTISIHALLAESDTTADILILYPLDFYPRSPCGERLESTR